MLMSESSFTFQSKASIPDGDISEKLNRNHFLRKVANHNADIRFIVHECAVIPMPDAVQAS